MTACPVCLEEGIAMESIPCKHPICKSCKNNVIGNKCPLCRAQMGMICIRFKDKLLFKIIMLIQILVIIFYIIGLIISVNQPDDSNLEYIYLVQTIIESISIITLIIINLIYLKKGVGNALGIYLVVDGIIMVILIAINIYTIVDCDECIKNQDEIFVVAISNCVIMLTRYIFDMTIYVLIRRGIE